MKYGHWIWLLLCLKAATEVVLCFGWLVRCISYITIQSWETSPMPPMRLKDSQFLVLSSRYGTRPYLRGYIFYNWFVPRLFMIIFLIHLFDSDHKYAYDNVDILHYSSQRRHWQDKNVLSCQCRWCTELATLRQFSIVPCRQNSFVESRLWKS